MDKKVYSKYRAYIRAKIKVCKELSFDEKKNLCNLIKSRISYYDDIIMKLI